MKVEKKSDNLGLLTQGARCGGAEKRLTVLRTHVYQRVSAVAKFFEINRGFNYKLVPCGSALSDVLFVVRNVAQHSTTEAPRTQRSHSAATKRPTCETGQYRIAVASGESRGSSSCQHFEIHPTLPRFGADGSRIADLPNAL